MIADARQLPPTFPPALRALVEAEVAAGNEILEVGAGHPAPPAGCMVKLAHDLRTWGDGVDGLSLYARNSSTHHQEITDADRFHWILTAPLPPPPEPDMDAIRLAHGYRPAPPPPQRTFPNDHVELDYRGEMLILHEADRRTDIVWTWNQGDRLYRSSLSPWWYPQERRSQPMTDEEKDQVIARFLDFARIHINSRIELHD